MNLSFICRAAVGMPTELRHAGSLVRRAYRGSIFPADDMGRSTMRNISMRLSGQALFGLLRTTARYLVICMRVSMSDM